MEGDLDKASALLKDIRDKCKDVTAHVTKLCSKAESGEFDTSQGISFLEVKYQMLLSYLTNLTYVMLKKTCGDKICGDPAIERLVEVRTVLEKMRPIDQKLKYQIDKVIRLASTGGGDANDPMRFKANPDSLESKVVEEGSGSDSVEESDDGGDEKGSKIYRPPKLAAMHYDGDETMADKQKRQLDQLRKRALNSDIMRDLKDQYDDAPQEIRENSDLHRMKADKKMKERTRYEEENFIRLPVTKKDKHASTQMATMSSLNRLTHFDSISALDIEAGDMQEFGAKRRKVSKSPGGKKGKKGKKGSKKRRF